MDGLTQFLSEFLKNAGPIGLVGGMVHLRLPVLCMKYHCNEVVATNALLLL